MAPAAADGSSPVGLPAVTVSGRQPRLALAFLAVERRPVLTSEIAELLWGEVVLPDHWTNAVRIVLSKIRTALAPLDLPGTVIRSTGGRVSLELPGGWTTDVDRARSLLAAAETEVTRQAAQAAELSKQAVTVINGPVLSEADGPWVTRLADQVGQLVGRASRVEIEAHLRRGVPAAAVASAEARVAADPLDESAHHLLIQSLLADGQRAAAWRAYTRLAEVLSTELGIAPSDATRALLADPVRRVPAIRSTPGRAVPGVDLLLGRDGQLDQLQRFWTEVADSGLPGLAVVEGHTGIGKTTLVREFTERVGATGAQILWGSCYSGSGLPYEPLVGAISGRLTGPQARATDPVPGPALADLLGGNISRGQLSSGALTVGEPVTDLSSPTSARSAVFNDLQAMVVALTTLPTVWVIDDLQWSSSDTTAFVDVLLERLSAPVLLIVTVRNLPAAVAESLSRWQRTGTPTLPISLPPLTPQDLLPLVEQLPTGTTDGGTRRAAQVLHERTGGHPFLVAEVARQAVRDGHLDLEQTPAGAREWVRSRAQALPADHGQLLDLAAVVGVRVPVDLLANCSAQPPDQLLDLMESLVHNGFLDESADVDGFVFPHHITREVVYERIGPTRRARLHGRVAEAIEQDGGAEADPALLAHHYTRSGPRTAAKAVRYALIAAERSLAVGAWALAQTQLQEVERLIGQPVSQAAAAVSLGVALHQQGKGPAARQALETAVELGRRHRLAPELAAAALKMVGRGGRGASAQMSDTDRESLLRECVAALTDWPVREDDRDTAETRELLRLKLEGELGWALLFRTTHQERGELALAGLRRLAEMSGPSPELEGQAVLNARSVRTHGADLAERTAEVERVLALPAGQLSAEVRLAALTYLHEDRLRAGDLAGARTALAEAALATDRLANPYWQWAQATWATLDLAIDGRVEQAEADLAAVTARFTDTAPEVAACYAVQLVCLRLLAGRGAEILPLIAGAADQHPHIPCYRAVLALTAAEIGDHTTAAAALAECARDGFGRLPDDSNRFLALAVLGDVAADLGNLDHATMLVELLEPWSGQQILLNCYGGGGAFWGPVDRVLARLGRLTGDSRAEGWAAAARSGAATFGSPWVVQRTERDLG